MENKTIKLKFLQYHFISLHVNNISVQLYYFLNNEIIFFSSGRFQKFSHDVIEL